MTTRSQHQESSINHDFTQPILDWFSVHGRTELPWKTPVDPYRIWISEIMLQQTQVKTAIPYFIRFLNQFPTLHSLAQASEDAVLALWSGLGYYSRARNLHQAAGIIQNHHHGIFPNNQQTLEQLPGIGPSTAAAICSLAYNQPTAILDGNVKRILSRYFLVSGHTEQASTQALLWQHAKQCMPTTQCAEYTQAIMDIGATLCKPRNPHCSDCPLHTTCAAHNQDLVSLYPYKKIKINLPNKHAQFLLLYTTQNRQLYLEKRPTHGIWGGLWCLLSLEPDNDKHLYLATSQGLITHNSQHLMNIKHTFSHFRLHMHVESIELSIEEATLHAQRAKGRWFDIDSILSMGLPKPIRQVIEHFATNHPACAVAPQQHPLDQPEQRA